MTRGAKELEYFGSHGGLGGFQLRSVEDGRARAVFRSQTPGKRAGTQVRGVSAADAIPGRVVSLAAQMSRERKRGSDDRLLGWLVSQNSRLDRPNHGPPLGE